MAAGRTQKDRFWTVIISGFIFVVVSGFLETVLTKNTVQLFHFYKSLFGISLIKRSRIRSKFDYFSQKRKIFRNGNRGRLMKTTLSLKLVYVVSLSPTHDLRHQQTLFFLLFYKSTTKTKQPEMLWYIAVYVATVHRKYGPINTHNF